MALLQGHPQPEDALEEILNESFDALELQGVLGEVALHACSGPGRSRVLASHPDTDFERMQQMLATVSELREMVRLHGPLGLMGLLPMEGVLSRLAGSATVLDTEEIFAIRDLAEICAAMMERLGPLEERFHHLRRIWDRLVDLGHLRGRIGAIFDEHGLVRATASPELMKIRDRLNSVRKRILKQLEETVRDRDLSHVVQEDYVTVRNDRYVILLRPEFKGYLDGVVHDHSRSGSSVYVEPLHVVELNNQAASLLDEEQDEIRRIFGLLTEEIRAQRDEIALNYDILSRLDAYQARALYADRTNSVSPELVSAGFRLLGARHPLLMADEVTDVVPMDVIQDEATSATVISGANLGGKTVALKIAGLFPVMTRCGILLPAKEGTKIHPFARVMADIGDDQDIRGGVSSFSGHVQRIKTILETAAEGDLVLLDELGGATDPEEGSALAMAIMDELIARGAKVLVTTHLTLLKAYAMGHQGVENVSVEFHPETLQPTYRLLYDLPGESHAIATAERIGVPPGVIEAAKRYKDSAAGGSSQLMERLRREITSVELRRSELEERRRELEEELQTMRATKEEIIEGFRKEAREVVRNAERQILALQRSIKQRRPKEAPKPQEELKSIRRELEEGLGTPLDIRVAEPSLGATVRVKSIGKEGTVSSLLETGKADILIGNVKIRADLEDLIILAEKSDEKSSSKMQRIRVDMPLARPRRSVNVIGLRVDEALPIIDRAVDEAVLGGLASIDVIHGKGTGRLKKAIWDFLSNHSLVEGLRISESTSGGEGATVVELKTD